MKGPQRIGRKDAFDQYFTPPAVARECWDYMHEVAPVGGEPVYVEPGAGAGAFYRLMPEGRRLAYDLQIQPGMEGQCREADWLALAPMDEVAPPGGFVAVGNPPFGHRGFMAAAFISKCFELGAAQVGMIVPAGLAPDATGPAWGERKVRGGHSVACKPERIDYFELPDGRPYRVKGAGFVIYRPGLRPRARPAACDSYVKLWTFQNYAHSNAPGWEGPVARCDYFVIATRFIGCRDDRVLVRKPDCEHRWIGIEVLRPEAHAVIQGIDWAQVGRVATKRNVVVAKRHIVQALTGAGLVDAGPVIQPLTAKRMPAKPGFDLA